MYRRDCLDKIGCETCLIWLCADWAFPFFVFIVLSSLCCFSMVDALIYPASEPRPPVKDMNTSRNTAWPPPVISLCYHFGKRRNTVRIYYSCLHWPNENCVARKNTSFFDLFFFVQLWACAASLKLAYFFFFLTCALPRHHEGEAWGSSLPSESLTVAPSAVTASLQCSSHAAAGTGNNLSMKGYLIYFHDILIFFSFQSELVYFRALNYHDRFVLLLLRLPPILFLSFYR